MSTAQPPLTEPEHLLAQGWKHYPQLPGHMGHIGPLWMRKTEGGSYAYGLLIAPHHLNPAGVAHGGVLMTLADQAISTAAWHACGKQNCLTLQLDSQFVASVALGEFVQADVDITHQTGGMVFVRSLLSVGGRNVLVAQGIMKVLRPRAAA